MTLSQEKHFLFRAADMFLYFKSSIFPAYISSSMSIRIIDLIGSKSFTLNYHSTWGACYCGIITVIPEIPQPISLSLLNWFNHSATIRITP